MCLTILDYDMDKKIIPAIIFGIVYAALILFGWGLDDVGGFF
jgi:hypothetical protein